MVTELIKKGANPYVDNNDGLTPDLCADAGGFNQVGGYIRRVQSTRVFNHKSIKNKEEEKEEKEEKK